MEKPGARLYSHFSLMDKQALEEELLRHLNDIQHVLDIIKEGGRVSFSEDLVKMTIESLKSVHANFTESVKWITTADQNLPPEQVRDPYMLLTYLFN